MDNREYLIWSVDASIKYVTLEQLKKTQISDEINDGLNSQTSLLNKFPSGIQCSVHKEFPASASLADNLYNADYLNIISLKLKEYLESKNLPNVEFLPVSVTQAGQSSPYFILHVVGPEKCIDHDKLLGEIAKAKSDLQENGTGLGTFSVPVPVLPEQLKDKPVLFRPESGSTVLLIRADLAAELEKQGFSGLRFVPLKDFAFIISTPSIMEGQVVDSLLNGGFDVDGKRINRKIEDPSMVLVI